MTRPRLPPRRARTARSAGCLHPACAVAAPARSSACWLAAGGRRVSTRPRSPGRCDLGGARPMPRAAPSPACGAGGRARAAPIARPAISAVRRQHGRAAGSLGRASRRCLPGGLARRHQWPGFRQATRKDSPRRASRRRARRSSPRTLDGPGPRIFAPSPTHHRAEDQQRHDEGPVQSIPWPKGCRGSGAAARRSSNGSSPMAVSRPGCRRHEATRGIGTSCRRRRARETSADADRSACARPA